MQNKSHLTAIARKSLPGPTQWLLKKNLLIPRVLDYGCGKAHEINNQHFKADGFDPFYRPDGITGSQVYNTIICNYVLCVLPTDEERREVLRNIQALLLHDGVAYVSVRADTPKKGHGWSSRGTFQAEVNLNLPLIHECRAYRLYSLTNVDKV